jgi:hemin uptake protein HemP
MQVTRSRPVSPHVPHDSDPPEASALRRIDSRELLGTARNVEIMHGKEIYRLCRTSQGKLILTK